MADLLVRLYALPPVGPLLDQLAKGGVTIRRALAPEKHLVADWMRAHGSAGWASESEVAFARVPLACFVAVEGTSPQQALVGVACYEATCRDFFGPMAVRPDRRRRGIGRALLLSALEAMRAEGYAYAIIGYADDPDFYRRAAGAVVIDGSDPGIYPPKLGS